MTHFWPPGTRFTPTTFSNTTGVYDWTEDDGLTADELCERVNALPRASIVTSTWPVYLDTGSR